MSNKDSREEELFAAALQTYSLDDAMRLVENECDNAELRSRLEKLIRRHFQTHGFLDTPVVKTSPPDLEQFKVKEGTRIGPYKLMQKLGEGGMGAVYMAEQTKPVERRVAVKIIKPGMDSQQIIARFEAERQALAMMDHPNIAKVFDAGTTEQGLPYFVMELVKGVPISEYCDSKRLSPRERLELFTLVCQAVQHAHQKGIIHRDLKPSNIMVALYDERPVPKVIDFGVAKATGGRLTDKTMFTQIGQVVGTFEYMSPEQAQLNQLDVDTRSDIYSLGTVLYEILTGTTPLTRARLRSAALDEVMRIIREEDPPRPSARISTTENIASIAANRHLEPKKLSLIVRGELDWIVMKSLEKDRARRYETASELALDIQRFLDDEPVLACPPSTRYKVNKFYRRNRLTVLASTVVIAALVGGFTLATWGYFTAQTAKNEAIAQRDEAFKQRRRAREAFDAVLSPEGLDWMKTQEKLLPEQKKFLETALAYYRDFARDESTETEGRRLVAMANLRIGQTMAALGQFDGAETSIEIGVAGLRSLANENPNDELLATELAHAQSWQTEFLRQTGDLQPGQDVAEDANQQLEQLILAQPENVEHRLQLVKNLDMLVEAHWAAGKMDHAEKSRLRQVEQMDILIQQHPETRIYKIRKSHCLNLLGHLQQARTRNQAATESFKESVKILEDIVENDDMSTIDRKELENIYSVLLRSYGGLGKTEQAIDAGTKLVEIGEQELKKFPNSPQRKLDTSFTHHFLGTAYTESGRWEEAETAFRRSYDLIDSLYNAATSNELYRNRLFVASVRLANSLDRLDRLEDADPIWERARELAPQGMEDECILQQAASRSRSGETKEALELVATLNDWKQLDLFQLYTLACTHSLCAKWIDNPAEQERLARKTVEILKLSIEKGFNKRGQFETDKDFDPVRNMPEFQELIAEFGANNGKNRR